MKRGTVRIRCRATSLLAVQAALLAVGVATVCMIGAGAAHAQEGQDAQSEPEPPYTGVVIEDNVIMRPGAGNAHYEVGQLDRGTVVRVTGKALGSWDRIEAPDNVFCYVSKAYVDARGDGTQGVVNSSRAPAYAARVNASPGDSYDVSLMLSQDDRVTIVGESGSFYKIKAPEGMEVFLPPHMVEEASHPEAIAARQSAENTTDNTGASDTDETDAQDDTTDPPATNENTTTENTTDENTTDENAGGENVIAQNNQNANQNTNQNTEQIDPPDGGQDGGQNVGQNSGATANQGETGTGPATQPVGGAATQPSEMVQVAGETGAPTTQPGSDQPLSKGPAGNGGASTATVQTNAVSDVLRAIEKKNIPLFMQPLDQQPLDRMIAEYQGLNTSELPAIDQRIVESRLTFLQRRKQLATTLQQVQAARQAADQAAQEAARNEPTRLNELAPEDYDAVGKVLASNVYDGENLPRMFRLVDPASGRTVAYIKPGGEAAAHRVLGEMVGIIGDTSFDDTVNLRVIEIERLDVLESRRE